MKAYIPSVVAVCPRDAVFGGGEVSHRTPQPPAAIASSGRTPTIAVQAGTSAYGPATPRKLKTVSRNASGGGVVVFNWLEELERRVPTRR